MARFNRTRLIEQLRDMAENTRLNRGFVSGNGTAQLRPNGCDEATEDLIQRAVEYGRWRAFESFADNLECGRAGT
jgi:hypothetical protein